MARVKKHFRSLKEKKEYIFLKTLNRAKNIKCCTEKKSALRQPK